VTIETALNAELDEHLGYQKHQSRTSTNSRNGSSGKSIITDDGEVDIDVPRDLEVSFELQLIHKHQTRFQSMDDNTLNI
jgi:transposase-like protein